MKMQYSFWINLKRLVYLLLLAVMYQTAIGQQSEEGGFYLFKKDWSAAKNINQATYFMQLIHENDSTYICRYYNKLSSMIRQESYLDSGFTIPNGRFCWYNQNGSLDSTGLVNRKRKNGLWMYYNNGECTCVLYNNGYLVEKGDYFKKELTGESGNNIPNSINNPLQDTPVAGSSAGNMQFKDVNSDQSNYIEQWKEYLQKAITVPERFISINKIGFCPVAVAFTIDNEGKTDDVYLTSSCELSTDNEVLSTFKKGPPLRFAGKEGDSIGYNLRQTVYFYFSLIGNGNSVIGKVSVSDVKPEQFSGERQVQAKFPGGPEAWVQFLQKNLNTDVPTNNHAPVGKYPVVVSFLVQKDGTVGEVKAEFDAGYGTAEEVIRVFKKSPVWIHATQDGKPIKYMQLQAVTFTVEQN
jgi:hypothetical protein